MLPQRAIARDKGPTTKKAHPGPAFPLTHTWYLETWPLTTQPFGAPVSGRSQAADGT